MSAGHNLQRTALRVTVITAALGLLLTGCSAVTDEAPEAYEPAQIEEVGNGLSEVTFTAEGARRVALKTSTVVQSGTRKTVDYAAIIYDGEGASWVYTVPKPLTYLRAKVVVDQIVGDRVLLTSGPPAGTKLVTVGATEVYGAELDIAGGH